MKSIHVERRANGDYVIDWGQHFAGQLVNIFAGRSPTSINMARPVVEGVTCEANIPGLSSGLRHYFYLQPSDSDGLIVAERNVPLQGGVNFRDLGGYATTDGRRVDWGRLFRSGHLSNLTGDDKDCVASLDIRTVCDLRVADELVAENTQLPGTPEIEVLGIPPGVKDRFFFHRLFENTDAPADVALAMHEVMRSLVLDSGSNFGRIFEILLEVREGNVLINCSAGKERTGIAAALILTALGVPREAILDDFMLSQVYFPAETELERVYEKYTVRATGEQARRLVMPLLETRESYLQSTFDAIDEHFGSGDAFLRQTYGLGDLELRHFKDTYTH